MRRRCDVNRSFWGSASIVCLRFLAERLSANGQGFSQGRANASRRATLTGSLPVCMLFRKTKARSSQNDAFAKEVSTRMAVSQKSGGFWRPSALRCKPPTIGARSNPKASLERTPEIIAVAESHGARNAFHRALRRRQALPRFIQPHPPHK